MNDLQRFGQVIAIAGLSAGPIAAAMYWIGHVIQDPLSEAGTLAVNSAVGLVIGFFAIGVVLVGVLLVIFWVWVFGIAWESRVRAADVE